VSKNLVIVESPAKGKTIEKYLGSDYSVKSSFGHIRDLPKKGLSIDKENNFEPDYEIPADKKKIISELKKDAAKADKVWLASDEDREGEAIAWHLSHALKLDPNKTERIVFHEITKPAIEAAIRSPRKVDQNLVDAQQARRVLDRLVGYELSPVLWKKVQRGLSAGRVQSVAVRLIVEREREIDAFKAGSAFKVTAEFTHKSELLKADLPKTLKDEKSATEFLEDAGKSKFTVADTEKKAGVRNPSPPFTTSSLQQEASAKLGFSVKQTMTLAQRLYENGHITYMRTDSTNLSKTALDAAAQYIQKKFGKNYSEIRQYKTKNASAQEAHEAIRPTAFTLEAAGADEQQKKLYQLIWKRALASQMASAKIDKTEIKISISERPESLIAKGETLIFDGFIKVYGGGKDDIILPDVSKGTELSLNNMKALQAYDRPPARYSEASLVKKLEELGIGRPSTYAPTISTIQTRGYVEKKDSEGKERKLTVISLGSGKVVKSSTTEKTGVERAKLLPTYLADITTDFLTQHFSSIVDYKFTARAEEEFDDIASGKIKWHKTIEEFYKKFEPLIKSSENVSRQETSQARELGSDPSTGKPIFARYGRYGPMLQKGETESEEKPTFAPLPEGRGITDVTLEEALEMYKLPRVVGKTADGEEITSNIGRFGPYIQVGKTFVSIKPLDPLTIDEEKARDLYAAKKEQEANKYVKKFKGGLAIARGPYGVYITDGKKNARIPKALKPEEIDEEKARELIDAAPARRKRR
jgi:DNA topoisomerase I